MKGILLALLLPLGFGAFAQSETTIEVIEAAPDERLTAEELDELLGPIALYPDPLLAALLPAATQPADIVLAVRFLNNGGNPDLIEEQAWPESIKAVAHYPDVIRWLDENLEWTTQVGRCFLIQPVDVMEAIQRLRRYAREQGNLETTPLHIVEVDEDGGEIDILPADPDYFYVPIYQPDYVYKRPAAGAIGSYVSFGSGRRVGQWFNHDWDWRNRRVVTWGKDRFRPRTWWAQSRKDRFQAVQAQAREWCPRLQGGKLPSKFWAERHQQFQRKQPAVAPVFQQNARMSRPAPATSSRAPAGK